MRLSLLLLLTLCGSVHADDQSSTEIEMPSRWSVLLPAFVVHGQAPTGGVNEQMPRRIDGGGRSVVTPGIGLEFRGYSGFDAIVAFLKDCYDNPAGTLQIGQHFKVGRATYLGYSLGLYIRETPIACYTETTTTTSGGGGIGPIRRPRRTNTVTNTTCGFTDNFPLRYTTESGGTFIDIIPSPFLNFSTEIFRGPFTLEFRFMTNFFLNEFGLAIPF